MHAHWQWKAAARRQAGGRARGQARASGSASSGSPSSEMRTARGFWLRNTARKPCSLPASASSGMVASKPNCPRKNSRASPIGLPSAATREQKRDESVVWPRDLNAPTERPAWGADPETVRDA